MTSLLSAWDKRSFLSILRLPTTPPHPGLRAVLSADERCVAPPARRQASPSDGRGLPCTDCYARFLPEAYNCLQEFASAPPRTSSGQTTSRRLSQPPAKLLLLIGEQLAQTVALNLAGGGHGQLGDERDPARVLVRQERGLDVL